MISANNVTLRIGKKALFEDVNIFLKMLTLSSQKVTVMDLLVRMVPESQHF